MKREGCNKRALRERTQPNGVIIRVPGRDEETEYALDVDYRTDLSSVQPTERSVPNVMVLTICEDVLIGPPHTSSGRGYDSV